MLTRFAEQRSRGWIAQNAWHSAGGVAGIPRPVKDRFDTAWRTSCRALSQGKIPSCRYSSDRIIELLAIVLQHEVGLVNLFESPLQ